MCNHCLVFSVDDVDTLENWSQYDSQVDDLATHIDTGNTSTTFEVGGVGAGPDSDDIAEEI